MKRAPTKPLPSQEFLLSILQYNPETGILRWLFRPPTTRSNIAFNKVISRIPGQLAGSVAITNGDSKHLTVGIKIDGKLKFFLAHRLIWKIMTGVDPVGIVDHEDIDGLNNRWINLREATHGENKWNGTVYKNNKSGFKGVCFVKSSPNKPWVAFYYPRNARPGRPERLGAFTTPEEAAKAWLRRAELERGEFMRAA
jgi:hypothetical protein